MNLDSRFKLPYPDSDLYEFESYRRKLGTGPLAPFKMKTPKRMQQNISGRVEKEPKLVGFKTAAGGPVREKMVLMFFDEKFSPSPSTVDRLIDKSAVPVLKIRHNKPHILPEDLDGTGEVAKFIRRAGEGVMLISYNVDNCEESLELLKRNKVRLIDQKPRWFAEYKRNFAFIHPAATHGALTEIIDGKY